MSIIANLEGWVTKEEGAVKAYIQELIDKVKGDKAAAIAALEAEIGKGSADLQAAWAKVKALL